MARTRRPHLVIRDAAPADAAAIARVHVEAWREAYRGQLPDAFLDGLSIQEWAESRQRTLEAPLPGVRTRVAIAGDEVAGFAAAGPARDRDLPGGSCEVYAIYLHPRWWSHGFGRALFEDAIAFERPADGGVTVLWVLETNARARRFYETAGWRADGARKVERRPGAVFREVRYRDR